MASIYISSFRFVVFAPKKMDDVRIIKENNEIYAVRKNYRVKVRRVTVKDVFIMFSPYIIFFIFFGWYILILSAENKIDFAIFSTGIISMFLSLFGKKFMFLPGIFIIIIPILAGLNSVFPYTWGLLFGYILYLMYIFSDGFVGEDWTLIGVDYDR